MKYVGWLTMNLFCLMCLYGTASNNDPKAAIYFFILVILSVTVPRRKVEDVSS